MDYLKQILKPHRKEVRKALVGGLAGLVLTGLGQFGVEPEMTVSEAVKTLSGGVGTYLLVWLFPNR